MESAHGEPHVLSDRASISRVIGFFPCRSDRCCHDERGFSSQTAVKVGLDAQCCDGCALIFLLLDPDRPGDARELVGQSAGGLVVIGARLNCERPTLEAINRSSGSVRHRRRAQHRTYCAGNSRTSMPRARSVLAQWCAEPQASITTRSHLAVIEPALKLCTRQTCPLDDLPARIGKREFEDVLCKVNSNGSSIHFGLLLSLVSLTPPNDSAWHDDAADRAGGVHPINRADPLRPTASAGRSCQTLGVQIRLSERGTP